MRIRIAFHPLEERFEVYNPAIQKNPEWIPDVAEVFSPVPDCCTDQCLRRATRRGADTLFATLERLRKIINNHVGVIELAGDLDIETVTEIFIRVNSAGATLSQADFAMSKIATNEKYAGNSFARPLIISAISPSRRSFFGRIQENDCVFAASELCRRWLDRGVKMTYTIRKIHRHVSCCVHFGI